MKVNVYTRTDNHYIMDMSPLSNIKDVIAYVQRMKDDDSYIEDDFKMVRANDIEAITVLEGEIKIDMDDLEKY